MTTSKLANIIKDIKRNEFILSRVQDYYYISGKDKGGLLVKFRLSIIDIQHTYIHTLLKSITNKQLPDKMQAVRVYYNPKRVEKTKVTYADTDIISSYTLITYNKPRD